MKEKSFYKNFFSLYAALVLQNVITISVNLVDNIMLGAYSETSLAAVAAVNQIQFIYQQILFATGEGLVILCSQYWGKKNIGPMKKIAAAAMRAALAIGLLLFVGVSLFPGQVLGFFTTDGPIISEGVKYLKIIRFTYLFFGVTQILLATLRSVEIVRIAFYLSVMTFFVNCSINYCLIFGHFGAPMMGTAGAAVGTLAARVLETAAVIVFILRKEKNLNLRPKDYGLFDKALEKDYFKVTAPMMFSQGMWGVNTALQTAILGHMTAAAIAANSVASTLFLLVKSMAVGAASAASVIIGKTIGSGDMGQVKRYARRLQFLFLAIGLMSGTALYFLRIPVLEIYRLRPETKAMANTFLIILSAVYPAMCYQMATNTGIIRGAGNSVYIIKLDLICNWFFSLPLSFFMAFAAGASPAAVVFCLNADQIIKCIPAYWITNHRKWVRTLTRSGQVADGGEKKE